MIDRSENACCRLNEFQVKKVSNYKQFYDNDYKKKEIHIKLVWNYFELKFILTYNM